jgi:hypothetical protein
MIGRGEKGAHTIYLIDFGLVKRIYQKNGEIFPVYVLHTICYAFD